MRILPRWFLATLVVSVLIMGTAPSASASPPGNDNFAGADVVSGLPFSDAGDLAGTTSEPGEPSSACLPSPSQTAWYVFTPSTAGSVKVDLAGSGFPVEVVVYQSSGGGFAGLSLVGCSGGSFSPSLVFAATAGSTYYLQVGMFGPGPSNFQLLIDPVTAPSNDNFAAAAPLSGTPVTVTSDLIAATVEAGEPAPGGSPLTASVWYAYTATTTKTLIVSQNPDPATVVAVYTGSSLGGLTELASGSGPFPPVHFAAQAGSTYLVQVAKRSFFPGFSSLVTITIDVPGPVIAQFSSYPIDPSIYDTVQFVNSSFDTAFIGFASEGWDLGDGVTATGCCPSHRYSADRDYAVTLTVTTLDGRTATTTQTVSVRTHDVSIERIQAPNSARAGQTKTIGVSVRGGRYAESVQVDLLKSVAGSPDVFIGSRMLSVPVAQGGRTTQFDFPYTFTPADGTTGKVTFKAFATILGARDALPADNQAIAPPTGVKA